MSRNLINTCNDHEDIMEAINSLGKAGSVLVAPDTDEEYFIIADTPDKIHLTVTSWIEAAGIHLNGRLRYSPVNVTQDLDGDTTCGGYLGGLDVVTDLEIEVERLVTQEDLDDPCVDWQYYSIGYGTARFEDADTLADAIDLFMNKYLPEVKVYYEGAVHKDLAALRAAIKDEWEK